VISARLVPTRGSAPGGWAHGGHSQRNERHRSLGETKRVPLFASVALISAAVHPPIAQLSVVPYTGNRYLAGAIIWDTVSADIGPWVANSPSGPWVHQPGNVATFQKRTSAQIGYDARIAQLPGADWTVVYSANDPEGQFSDWTLYRGQFATPNALP
jgi:hypothetical protein